MKNTYFQNGKETFLNINKELYRIFDEADLVNVEFLTNEWRKLNISNIKDAKIILKPFIFSTIYEMSLSEGHLVDVKQIKSIIDGNLVSFTGSLETVMLINNLKKAVNYVIDAGILKMPLTSGLVYNIYTLVSTGITKNDFDYFKRHMYRSKAVSENIRKLAGELRKRTNSESILDLSAYIMVRMHSIQPFESFNFAVAKLLCIYYLLYNGYPPILFKSAFDFALEDCIISASTDDELCEVTAVFKYLLKNTLQKNINYNNFNKRIEDYFDMEVNNE